MNQKELSIVAEIGLLWVAMDNDIIDRDLILQYYTEEQLEWYARSRLPESNLARTRENIRSEWQNYVDTYTGKLPPFIEQLQERLAKKGMFITL